MSTRSAPRRRAAGVLLTLLTLCASLLTAAPARADTTFMVTASRIIASGDLAINTDPPPDGCGTADCSLREAVIAANTTPGADVITFAEPGMITLTATTSDPTGQLGWDLVITEAVRIEGPSVDAPVEVAADFGSVSGTSRLFRATAPLELANLDLFGQAVDGDGGIVRAEGPLDITDSSLQEGEAYGRGGAISSAGSDLSLTGSTISDSIGRQGGGAIAAVGFNAVQIDTSTVFDNQTFGTDGGAIHATGATTSSTLTVTGSVLLGNRTPDAPDFPNDARGGAIYLAGGRLTVDGSLLVANGAEAGGDGSLAGTHAGGAIFTDAVVEEADITGSVLSANAAEVTGGAIDAGGESVNVRRSLVQQTTTGRRGAIHVQDGTSLFLINSTVTGSRGGDVTAVAAETGDDLVTIAFSTISDSGALPGPAVIPLAAVSTEGAPVLLASSILSDHAVATTCAGDLTSLGYNIAEDASCDLSGPDDLPDTNPQIGPLAANGAPSVTLDGISATLSTHAPAEGSPALDSADPTLCGTEITGDQRDVSRPQGPGCDRGAHEVEVDDIPPPPEEPEDPEDPEVPEEPETPGSGCVGTDAEVGPAIVPGSNRVEGLNRIQTAIVASRAICDDGVAPAVVLTRADLFPDAQAGTPLAIELGAPLLLSSPDRLDGETATEIQRVLPAGGTVYLLGGTVALSDTVVSDLTALGYETVRYGGVNRFETAAIIAADGLADPGTLLVADGGDFADSIVAGAAAAVAGGADSSSDDTAAVLLTSGRDVPPETASYLAGRSAAEVIAIGRAAGDALPAVEVVSGATRFETALAVADRFFPSPTVVGIARADDFADGLTGGAVVGRPAIGPGPIVLVATENLPDSVEEWLSENATTVDTAVIFGGTAAVSSGVAAAIEAALGLVG